jgi:hypothetical protein
MSEFSPQEREIINARYNTKTTPTYSTSNRLQGGYDRGIQLAQQGGALPPIGTKGFEASNLTNAVIAGFNSYKPLPTAPKIEVRSAPSTHTSQPAPQQPAPQAPKPPIKAPSNVKLPTLTLTDGTSVVNQLNKLQSLDSITAQQALQQAKESGSVSGGIHSSQQGGAGQRAVMEALQPLAREEAQRKAGEEVQNWSTAVKAEMDRYDKEYTGYLAKLGIGSNEKIAMLQANTSLSNSLMGNITSLLNNTDLELSSGVTEKLTSIFGTSLKNNNTILDMGFTYA